NLYSDGNFVQAAVRSSYGRRPATSSRLGTSMPVGTAMGLRLPTAASCSQMGVKRLATGGINAHHPLPLSRARTGIAGGTAAGLRTGMPSELARPMTAIRGAGYSSAGRKSTFDKIPIQQNEDNNNLQNEENVQLEKAKKLEDQAMEQLLENKAKEATRQWRTSDNLRKSSGEQQNMDLGWCSLLCLAQQKLINGIPSEALNIYQTIVKNRSYANGHRLKINIGNIYFRKKEYTKALKYYRMALDQVPKVHQRMRAKILSNIGVAMVRLGRYEDALSSFEESLELSGRSAADYSTALNLIMAAYCLGNEEKMRESFQRLVDIPILIDENKQQQVIELLRQGHLDQAIEDLLAFNSKTDGKIASAASNNLALINLLKGEDKLEDALQYCEQALSLDRYNSNALVNRGNIHFYKNEPQLALQCFREALQVDSGCIQAIYNSGLVCRLLGQLDEAKRNFFKLNDMLAHEPQVLIQLAEIYNQQGEHSQAIELFTQASTLAPTDPSILERLASIYENFGDNSTAFQYFRDSFHHFPSNISLIKWLGNYYMSAHFSEKAVLYFEKAALMEPNNPEWPMLTAGCQRRSGNFQRALEIYKQVHRRFPENVECLKFLVQLSKELRLTVEERDYTEKLGRIEKIGQLKAQRESGGQRQLSANNERKNIFDGITNISTPNSQRNSGRVTTTNSERASQILQQVGGSNQNYQATKRDITADDLIWKDNNINNNSFSMATRPMTGMRRAGDEQQSELLFENDDGDELLPD
uniref:Intraflagellar transport protein 88-like protein n=1 Tax=Meloidogyne javanica TaxID=6303 RepID=A0A915LF34_MELJA